MVQDGFECREMNDAEFAQYEIDQVKAGEQVEKDLEKASAKASAESKLKALGLTDAEISALIG